MAATSVTSFLLGAGAFIHEVSLTKSERPTVLLASLALLGAVPITLALEKLRR